MELMLIGLLPSGNAEDQASVVGLKLVHAALRPSGATTLLVRRQATQSIKAARTQRQHPTRRH